MQYNPYRKDSKIYDLYEQIKKIAEMYPLLHDEHIIGRFIKYYQEDSHLYECIVYTKKYPFMNEYIDEYLKLYPKKIHIIMECNTILMEACRELGKYTTYETIKILIKHKANVNFTSKYNHTALMCAIDSEPIIDTYKTVKMLLKRGVNLDIVNCYGYTALMLRFNE